MHNAPGVFCDFTANRGRPHIQLALVLFRLAQRGRTSNSLRGRAIGVLASVLYRFYAISVLSLDIPVSTNISQGLVIHHGMGLVVHNLSKIGSGVILRQNTTIGSKAGSAAPVLGNGVDVGANCVVLGDINIGDHAVVGAGAVVTKSFPAKSVLIGNPARSLKTCKPGPDEADERTIE